MAATPKPVRKEIKKGNEDKYKSASFHMSKGSAKKTMKVLKHQEKNVLQSHSAKQKALDPKSKESYPEAVKKIKHASEEKGKELFNKIPKSKKASVQRYFPGENSKTQVKKIKNDRKSEREAAHAHMKAHGG